MIRVLLVDDEPAIHRFLAPVLATAGYRVDRADTGRAALDRAAGSPPDVVLLDLGLPDMDGKEVLKRLRDWSDVPVIVISARDREYEKIQALDLGADDFVNKPFGIGELLARMRAALRRRVADAEDRPVVVVGPYRIDLARRRVEKAGVAVHLTRKEFDLLAHLARNAGAVVTHARLLAAVWGASHADDTQYLRVYVGQIRNKMEGEGDPPLIVTEPGVGYRLVTE